MTFEQFCTRYHLSLRQRIEAAKTLFLFRRRNRVMMAIAWLG